MAEDLKQVIEKLKAQQKQNSPQSKPATPKPIKKVEVAPVEEEFEDEDEDEEDLEEEVEEVAPKPQLRKKPAQISQEIGQDEEKMDDRDKILMEIELLQSNGRFRVELLHQFQEMNKALVVIAGVLVDQNENRK
jgi:hypothetical protein